MEGAKKEQERFMATEIASKKKCSKFSDTHISS